MNAKNVLLLSVVLAGSPALAAGPASGPKAVDYSKAEHWLALPAAARRRVDVFYLYPTAWLKADPKEPDVCAIDNPSMRKGSRAAFARQATAFDTVGDIYAPYYRQADAAYTLALPLAEQAKIISGLPKADAFAAFDYYIKHYNKGRPFILAGHSQGSNLLLFLLAEYMKANPKVYARMVAAYLIGYSVTDPFLSRNPHLRFARGPDDTGVIISYNTESPGVAPGANPVVLPGARAINPITWTTEETPASAEQSLGSFLPDASGRFAAVPHRADARVDKKKGVVVCTAEVDQRPSPLPKGVLHSYDYPFYYFDIRRNAAVRAAKFLRRP